MMIVERPIAEAIEPSKELKTLQIEWTKGINQTISGLEDVTMQIFEVGGNKRYLLSEVCTANSKQLTVDHGLCRARFLIPTS